MYFNESHEGAKRAVAEVLELYQTAAGQLDVDERGKLQRSMGLKMEQLKVGSLTLFDSENWHLSLRKPRAEARQARGADVLSPSA